MPKSLFAQLTIPTLIAVALSNGPTATAAEKDPNILVLARQGQSEFTIVVAGDASPSTRYAAEELQRFLHRITGAKLPIQSANDPIGKHEIILGDNAHLRQLEIETDCKQLGMEGYLLRTTGDHLLLTGGEPRGNLYAVYGLLEDHFGCRWFTPKVDRIPKTDLLTVGPLNESTIPVLEYREPFVMDCFDGDWCARNRVNSSAASLEARHGGKVRFGHGMFVHTFNVLMPPATYFDTHPEYYSEIDGARVRTHTQLCCTNEEVVQICIEQMRKRMRADPGATVFSLSQNDWNNYCECAHCQAVADREGSQMGPVIGLVNRVAKALEDEFPNQAIETLAYTYTRKPPKKMRPRPNVIIRLCSIECCFMHPLETCPEEDNQEFVRDLRQWSKVAERLWVWDYVTSFHDYLVPFPNLRVRDDNIRLFSNHHVTGIFEQDAYTTLNGELSPLSGYLNAKLLWNPNYGEDQAINEFLQGVYGPAASPIREYIDLIHDKVADENIHADIWVQAQTAPFLTSSLLARADQLWDQAEEAVAVEPTRLARVQVARLSVDYAILRRERGAGGSGQFTIDHERFRAQTRPEYLAKAERFLRTARRAGITWLNEGRLTLDQFEAELKPTLTDQVITYEPSAPVAVQEKEPGVHYAYFQGTWLELPDFNALTPAQESIASELDLRHSPRTEQFALRFSGLLDIPRDGLYTFYTNSNDGSRLSIGGKLVVDNNGLHSARKVGGFVALKAGLHPLELEYFQEGGSTRLDVTYEGPGMHEGPLSKSVLFHGPQK